MKKLLSFKSLVITLLILVALGVRLYGINNSMTEWFSWRQSDTAAVGRFLIRDNFNLLQPRFYDLSDIQSGKDNPNGWRMVEFPLYNAAFAGLYTLFPSIELEVWARLVTIVLSLMAMLVIYYFLHEEFGEIEAFFGALFFAVAPYVVFYSRVILPDMPAVSLTLISLFFFYRYTTRSNWNLLLGSIFFALALLVKPTVAPYTLAVGYLLLKKHQTTLVHKILYGIVFGIIAFVPLMLWRIYIQKYPEGIAANQWLFTSVNTYRGLENVFLRPAFFRWIFFERINNMITGGYLLVFALLGAFAAPKKKMYIHLAITFSALAYLFIFQGGNVQHDYYQTLITPALALLIGAGAGWFMRAKKMGFMLVRLACVVVFFAFSLFFSFYQIMGNYNENKDLTFIGDTIRSLTSKNDIIVTDTMGDTTLLYLSDRRGYPAPYRDLAILKQQGAKYYVTRDSSYKEKLAGIYELVFENDKVLIFAL